MKRNFVLLLIAIALISCSVNKQHVIHYRSERLCGGIKNMYEYIKNSNEIKDYFFENPLSPIQLNCEIDTLVTEGIPFPFLQSEVAKIIEKEEKVSFAEAYRRLEFKFLSKPTIIQCTNNEVACSKKRMIRVVWHYCQPSLKSSNFYVF
ncbi:hypothetical protein [Flavobacterium lindanitolerans]|uniref:Lipoprotein n=1 Tax=Flavobacterium lindanitolerans TaxID=428988 RepID=A0A497VC38_9FLAO|nr:hypothetical protein [Flavobacterium lindanitolerans]MBC8643573.1 hypothetical protein [Flavobacterium lindanitolerans]PKW28707.1 hypothetical protein B0G92_0332 [Flavobacterium lindanitolerans]RLJ35789.1 hypothetical protein CLV50_1173 [Flavobacterium lindanitolerans]